MCLFRYEDDDSAAEEERSAAGLLHRPVPPAPRQVVVPLFRTPPPEGATAGFTGPAGGRVDGRSGGQGEDSWR
ncbi:hypothetical protein [Streptomyces sp. cmx-4-9]|uniref:hypothetical protein n=1 Tax=Streptomyces sp. cmx-4-9 TaxID=2790941 RepID=UPI0039804608